MHRSKRATSAAQRTGRAWTATPCLGTTLQGRPRVGDEVLENGVARVTAATSLGCGDDRSQALVAQDRPVCRGGAAEGLDVERVGEFDEARGERHWVLLGGRGRAGVHRLEP